MSDLFQWADEQLRGVGRPVLLDIQQDLLRRGREAYVGRIRRVIYQGPCGSGKTVCAAEQTRIALGKIAGSPSEVAVMHVVHRRRLVDQMVWTLERFSIGAAPVMDGRERWDSPVLCASRDTLLAMLKDGRELPRSRFLIWDEAHVAASAVQDWYLKNCPDAYWTGYTATPIRPDGSSLNPPYQALVCMGGVEELVKIGRLCHVKVFDPDAVGRRRRQGKKVKPAGDPVKHWLRYANGLATVAYTSTVRASKRLAEDYQAAGVTAEHLDGSTSDEAREAIYQRSKEGTTKVICNCLDDQTEILTARGWVGIDGIQDDDVTATMNLYSEGLFWQPIQWIVKRDREQGERMVSISNQTIDVRVTEGHRMVVRAPGARKWSVVEAGTLPSRGGPYQLPLAPEYGLTADAKDSIPLGATAPQDLSYDECKFIGLWMADGHLDTSGGGRGITIGQSQRYHEANLEIRTILTGCGFDWRMHSKAALRTPFLQNVYGIPKGALGGKLSRRGFHRLLPYLDKDFSPLLFQLRSDQAEALMRGIWLGDGDKDIPRNGKGIRSSWRISNTNKLFMDRLQRLAVTNGFAANLSGPMKNGPLSTKPLYRIIIRRRRHLVTNNRFVATSDGNPARFDEAWIPERVWCVTNKSGTIITRRNGKVMVMGQCGVLIEGLDLPWLVCCQILRGCNSLTLWLQGPGRVMRAFEGKKHGIVLDHSGAAHEFGRPDRDFDWVLEDESANRARNKQPKDRKPVVCLGCGLIFAWQPACPECGKPAPARRRAPGPLTLTGDAVLTEFEEEQNGHIRRDALARTFRSCYFIGRAKGLTMGVVATMFKNKAKVLPWEADLPFILPGRGEWQTLARDWLLEERCPNAD